MQTDSQQFANSNDSRASKYLIKGIGHIRSQERGETIRQTTAKCAIDLSLPKDDKRQIIIQQPSSVSQIFVRLSEPTDAAAAEAVAKRVRATGYCYIISAGGRVVGSDMTEDQKKAIAELLAPTDESVLETLIRFEEK